jgi:hypothetical protein
LTPTVHTRASRFSPPGLNLLIWHWLASWVIMLILFLAVLLGGKGEETSRRILVCNLQSQQARPNENIFARLSFSLSLSHFLIVCLHHVIVPLQFRSQHGIMWRWPGTPSTPSSPATPTPRRTEPYNSAPWSLLTHPLPLLLRNEIGRGSF